MRDFQAFTIKYNGITNVLFSEVGISEAHDLKDQSKTPEVVTVRAIWDTGATCTVITKKLAEKIGLVPTGKTNITVVGGNNSTLENTYIVNVYLPNKVCMIFVRIVEVSGLTGDAEVLIGMDIIGSGDFSIFQENGKTIMTYRYPSIGGTDFVVEAGNIKSHRVVMQKIEDEKKRRKPLSAKEIEKRKRKKKNKKKHKRRH